MQGGVAHTRPSAGARLPVVDQLRGVAALLVAWHHVTQGDHVVSLLQAVGDWGWLGVDVFFVISGFVIPYSISRSFESYDVRAFFRFMAVRATRIEIPYVVSILLTVSIAFAAFSLPGFRGQQVSVSFGQLASHVLYLVPFTSYEWIQSVYWTLGYEFIFYILIGLSYPFVMGPNRGRAFIAVVVGICAAQIGLRELAEPPPNLARATLFLVGLAVARHHLGQDKTRFSLIVIAGCAMVMIWLRAPAQALAGVCASMLIMHHSALASLGADRASLLRRAGTMSYSLYVTHLAIAPPLMNRSEPFFPSSTAWDTLQAVFVLAMCVCFAGAFYLLVERPSIRLSHRLKPKRARREGAPRTRPTRWSAEIPVKSGGAPLGPRR